MNMKIRYMVNIFIIPVVLFIFFSLVTKGFGLHSIPVILNQTILPTAMGFAMGTCLLAGMVDLSVGVKIVLGAVVGGTLASSYGIPGLIIGCFIGALAGSVVQSVLYRILRIPSMVLSIGIIMLYEVVSAEIGGAAAYVGINRDVYSIFSYPKNVVTLVVAAAFFYVILYHTKVGCQIKAIGNDEKLCKSMGVKVDRVKFYAYIISAVLCGFSAILVICYSGTISVPTGMSTLTMVFKPIMGVLIGMQLVKIYDNLPLLIFIGELSIQIVFNGFIAMGLTDAWQNVMLGMFILIVIYFTGPTAPSFTEIKKKFRVRKVIKMNGSGQA